MMLLFFNICVAKGILLYHPPRNSRTCRHNIACLCIKEGDHIPQSCYLSNIATMLLFLLRLWSMSEDDKCSWWNAMRGGCHVVFVHRILDLSELNLFFIFDHFWRTDVWSVYEPRCQVSTIFLSEITILRKQYENYRNLSTVQILDWYGGVRHRFVCVGVDSEAQIGRIH